MRFKFLFGMVMFSLLFYGCKSKVTKWLDKLEAEISRVEDLCERASEGNMSDEEFTEEFQNIIARMKVLFEEGDRLADYDITEEESLRLEEIGSRYDNITDMFTDTEESNNDSYSDKNNRSDSDDKWWDNDDDEDYDGLDYDGGA